ncbi:peptidyl-alpha-hydroxyglycine alpha-amidating lyase family protein [uncultured Flavobacterium sp.]|uniref:peptidyl-alpha-hydroxyglycine alpha-amidating lyase family protein n=1 Tax=uncultured Flavobacterium sp. TaxID=165435 RepID=UPI0030EF9C75
MEFKQKSIFYFLLTLLIFGCKNTEKEELKKESENSDSYILVNDWPKLPENFVLGNPTGLGINSENNIVVFHRANRIWEETMQKDKIQENTILTLNKQTGEVLKSWGADLFIMPHGLEVDKQNNIWVTDCGLHQVFKFDSNGNLLMILGEAKVPGDDSSHFNEPTDIAVTEDGSFYISDGYENSRIAKFSKEGEYLFEWGKFGNKQGEFNIPHGIDLDNEGNVYVADRENNRIQKFDAKGNFIAVWQNKITEQLYSVTIDNQKRPSVWNRLYDFK